MTNYNNPSNKSKQIQERLARVVFNDEIDQSELILCLAKHWKLKTAYAKKYLYTMLYADYFNLYGKSKISVKAISTKEKRIMDLLTAVGAEDDAPIILKGIDKLLGGFTVVQSNILPIITKNKRNI